MGWCTDDSHHEGYLVALESDEGAPFIGNARRREVHANPGETIGARVVQVTHVQVGCSCGWRSPVLQAPHGTEWLPSCVHADAHFERVACELWSAHVRQSPAEADPQTVYRLASYLHRTQRIVRGAPATWEASTDAWITPDGAKWWFCAGRFCPGLGYRASERAHPTSCWLGERCNE